MIQKPPFADLIDERPPFFGLTFKKAGIIILCLALLSAGVIVFKDILLPERHHETDLQSPSPTHIQKMVARIQNLEKEIADKQNDVLKLVLKYKEKTGRELSYFNLLNLKESEKQLLEDRIRQEKRVSLKSLLETILEGTQRIGDLKKRMSAVEKKLPVPSVVTEGETHYRIALDYLLKKHGLDRDDAVRLVESSMLCENILPGFKVWNCYSQGEFGTFVTKGEAVLSPGRLQKMEKQKSIEREERMVAERDRLTEDIGRLKNDNSGLNLELIRLNEEHSRLSGQYSHLETLYRELEKQWNSLFYRLDLKRHLVEQGIIKDKFLSKANLNTFTADDFKESIDLRTSRQIKVTARRFNADKIKDVVLYPRFFKKDVDYQVSMDEEYSTAVLTIMNPDKLKNERVVISVE